MTAALGMPRAVPEDCLFEEVSFRVDELAALLGVDVVRLGRSLGRLERAGQLHITADASCTRVRFTDHPPDLTLLHVLERWERL